MPRKPEIASRIQKFIWETHDTVTWELNLTEPLPHIPGQSIGIDPKQYPGLEERFRLVREVARQKTLRPLANLRLYSLADSSPDFKRLCITIKKESDKEGYPPALFTPFALSKLGQGDPVQVTGPYGKKFLFRPRDRESFILWGAGSGVVPLKYFMEYAHHNQLKCPLLFFDSNKTPEDIIYRERLEELASKNPHLRVVHTITRLHLSKNPWKGRQGRLLEKTDGGGAEFSADVLSETSSLGLKEPLHYICGPLAFGRSIKQALLKQGVPADRIFMEAWG